MASYSNPKYQMIQQRNEGITSALNSILQTLFPGKSDEDVKKEKRQNKINKYLEALGDEYEKEITGFDEDGDPEWKVKKNKSSQRQEKINKYLEGLGDEYEKDNISFDEEGIEKFTLKKKKDNKILNDSPEDIIKNALWFDKGIDELGQSMNIKKEETGFPLAGGGLVLPSDQGGEIGEGAPEPVTEKVQNYNQIVKQALMQRFNDTMDDDGFVNRLANVKDEKTGVTTDLIGEINNIYNMAITEHEKDPRGTSQQDLFVEAMQKLAPKYADNKDALERIIKLIKLNQ